MNNTKKFLIDNKSKIFLTALSVCIVLAIVFFINSDSVLAVTPAETAQIQKNFDKAYNDLAKLIRHITGFMVGFSVISGVGTVIYHLIRLGACGSNPQARAKTLQDMFTTAICIALLGSFNLGLYLIMSLFNAFK